MRPIGHKCLWVLVESQKVMKPIPIVVLADGETWTSLNGCQILYLTQEGMDRLDAGEEPNDLNYNDPSLVVGRIALTSPID